MRRFMVRSLIQPVSAAISSMINTISGSAVEGVWSRVMPRIRSSRSRITCTASSSSSRQAGFVADVGFGVAVGEPAEQMPAGGEFHAAFRVDHPQVDPTSQHLLGQAADDR